MKILVINWQDIKNPRGGGAEVHMHEIFKRIAAKGHQVTIFSCAFAGAPSEEIIDGIRIIRHGRRSFFNFHVPGWWRKRFRHQDFDLVIDDINKIPFYTPLFVKSPLLAISHHFFGKSIFREAGLIAGIYVFISEFMVDFIYKKTPFVVVSQSTLDEFIDRGFDTRNFRIVQNAIHPNDFPMAVGKKFDYPCVTYFGRLKKYKSVDHLLYAFVKVKERIPDARLNIMGTGSFRPEMERIAKELGIDHSTRFFGYVSEDDKISLLSKAHVCVNTSMKEGWGITNIEANACGTPVISSNVPGLRDSVRNGQSGLLYEYGNIDELADKLTSALTDRDLLNKLSNGAVEWASEFSWDKSADEMEDACLQIAKYQSFTK